MDDLMNSNQKSLIEAMLGSFFREPFEEKILLLFLLDGLYLICFSFTQQSTLFFVFFLFIKEEHLGDCKIDTNFIIHIM